MKVSDRTRRIALRAGVSILIFSSIAYAFFEYTSVGRLTGLYAVAGFRAPWSVRSACFDETRARVAEKFTQPLNMNEEGRTALREYWHYAYERECLYRAHYSFLGAALPASTLTDAVAALRYTNEIAGVEATVPMGTRIQRDNILDVEYDYRLYKSDLVIGSSTVMVDAYTNHEDIHTFDELTEHVQLLVPADVTVVEQESQVGSSSVTYLRTRDSVGRCGAAFLTPLGRIVYLTTSCDSYRLTEAVVNTVTFLPEAVSVQ